MAKGYQSPPSIVNTDTKEKGYAHMIKAGMKGTFKRKGSPPMKQIYQQCHYAVIWEPW